MSLTTESWSTQQLVEFVALISEATDRADAAQRAIERAAEALEAEICALVRDGSVLASIGFVSGAVPEAELREVVEQRAGSLALPGLGDAWTLCAALEGEQGAALVAARAGAAAFTQEEADLLRGMARVLALTLRMLDTLDHERELRRSSQREARQRRKAERELAHHTLHDALTGLPNRSLLRERASHAIERSGASGVLVGALFVDVDNFKLVNDTLGPSSGDRLLVAVSRRLQGFAATEASRLRGCTVARVGGDEFVVLCEELTDEHDAVVLAEQVLESLRFPLMAEERTVGVSASIGIAIAGPGRARDGASPDFSTAAEDLIRDADMAMSRAKENGRDCYEVFDEPMRLRMVDRLQLEEDLRLALQRGELRLVYQPVVSVSDASTVSLEALVRWQHPQRGLLLPGSFVGVAEESELIVELGEWVLREACLQLAAWQREGGLGAGVRLSVNVSARQLRPSFVAFVRETLEAAGVAPERLALEITERLLIEQADSSGSVLGQLRDLGVWLVLDDFGTGYSSLSYLKSFPLDQIKLDRAFTAGLVDDPRSAKIVSATIEMARALGMTVVAEGVENSEQLQVLQRLRCDFAQGFHIAFPQPAQSLTDRLRGCGAPARPELLRDERGQGHLSPDLPERPQPAGDLAAGRRLAVGRVAGLFFATGGLLTTPSCLMLNGVIDPLVAVGLSLMALLSGLVCLVLPWRALRDWSVHATAGLAVAEVLLTIRLVGHPAVFSWFYVLIAAAAAYAFPSRRVLAGYTLILLGAMFLPALWQTPVTGDVVARMVVGSAVLGCAVAATAALRERLEAGQAELQELVARDALTGVGNYRLLHDRLEYELRRHQRGQRQFALLLVDLDRFKQVNERHGHAAGDEALRRVARALTGAVRQQDTVARQGGDEFAVLAPETGPDDAARLAARIRERVGAVRFAGEPLGATIGVAVFPADGGSAQVLLARADGRLMADKSRGRLAVALDGVEQEGRGLEGRPGCAGPENSLRRELLPDLAVG